MYYFIPIITLFGFYNISLKIKHKLKINYDSLLFSLILFLLTLVIFTNLIFFKINLQFTKYIILIVLTLSFIEFLYSHRSSIISKINENKFSFLIYFFLATISLIPLAGADSYAYHLAWPKDLLLNSEIIFNKLNLEYRVVGNGEVVNYIGLLLGTENLQSFISISILFFFILSKKNKNLIFLIIISSPIFLKYCFDQKPFILPCLIFSIILGNFIKNINLNKIQNLELISFFLALVFFAGSKYPFLLIGFIVSLIFLTLSYKYKFLYKYLFFGLIIFIVYFLPLPLAKFLEFGDPFSPFLEGLFNNSSSEILKLKQMYKVWDGFKISGDEDILTNFRNIFNFIIPIAPFSILDTYGVGFALIFFYRFRDKLNYVLIFILLTVTSVMVYLTNFQSRWYIFLILFIVLNHHYLAIPEKIMKIFTKIMSLIIIVLLSFYLIFFGYVIYNSNLNSFEDTKNKLLYLYKEINHLENLSNGKLILTNTRTNYFSNNLVQYKYPNYSKKYMKNYVNLENIKYGFFSIGGTYKNEQELKEKSILKNFEIDCYDILNFSKKLVAKRNFLSRKDYEQFVLIKFNRNINNCLI